jgi:hypothetical protein
LFGRKKRKIHQVLGLPRTVTGFTGAPLTELTMLETAFRLHQHFADLYGCVGLRTSHAVNVVNDFTQPLLMGRGKAVIVIALGHRHIPLGGLHDAIDTGRRHKSQQYQYDGNLAALISANLDAFAAQKR